MKKSDIMLYKIKKEMVKYQKAFDSSINQRKIVDCFIVGSQEHDKLNERLIQYENRCIEIDARINLLYQQWLKNQFA